MTARIYMGEGLIYGTDLLHALLVNRYTSVIKVQCVGCSAYRRCCKSNAVATRLLSSLVAKALDLQLAGCEFNSRPRRCRVTTLGKLFTPTCLSRSQWFGDGTIDCGVRGRGRLCLSRCTALGTGCAHYLQCLGSTQPSTLRGTVK